MQDGRVCRCTEESLEIIGVKCNFNRACTPAPADAFR